MRPLRAAAAVLAILIGLASCGNPLGRQYEYEEQLYLSMDGGATVVIDSSIPALVALRGMPLDAAFRDAVDRDQVRRLFAVAGCEDVRVGQPWVRRGRRFVQVRVSAERVEDLARCGPLSWSTYQFGPEGEAMRFRQTVGPPAGEAPAGVNWDGRELLAFRLHAPSRILFHNVKRLDGTNGEPGRGNILTWEQRLTDRLAGEPVSMDVLMDSNSILYRTLWLFAGAFAAAVLLLVGMIWFTIRRGRARVADAS